MHFFNMDLLNIYTHTLSFVMNTHLSMEDEYA